MIGGNNLRKAFGLRRIRLMAADAEYGRIEFFGGHGSRIVRVLGQRSVAGFAIHVRVLAIFFLFQDVGMAAFASLVPREIHWPDCDFRQCVAAIVPILSKTFWDQKTTEDQEQEDARDEDSRQSKKMSRILEGIHGLLLAKNRCARAFSAFPDRRKRVLPEIQETSLTLLCSTSPWICAAGHMGQ